jgi:hypothetical protein
VSETPVGERLARIETLEEFDRMMRSMHRRLDKQYSFLGGIAFVISGLWVIAQTVIQLFFRK